MSNSFDVTYSNPASTETHTVQVFAPTAEEAAGIADNYRKMVNPDLEAWNVEVLES